MNEKTSVLERISKRDAQRIDKLQKTHKANDDIKSTNEQEDYFSGIFKEKSNNIEELLTEVPALKSESLPSHFGIIKREVIDLQKYVVTSSLFLKEFNLRKYLGIVQNLQTQCYDLEERYIPRKKFGFSKKNAGKTESVQKDYKERPDVVDARESHIHKLEEKLFGFDSRENEILLLGDEELYQRDVSLRNLRNSTIGLKGVLGTLHISGLTDCVVLCGPVTTSVFVDKCTNCKIVVACQQLRMHSSTNCDIYLHVTSKGIIEDCSNIRTAPYNLWYEGLENHYLKSSLDPRSNNWDRLDDFNWLAAGIPSPNWLIMAKAFRVDDWSPWWDRLPM